MKVWHVQENLDQTSHWYLLFRNVLSQTIVSWKNFFSNIIMWSSTDCQTRLYCRLHLYTEHSQEFNVFLESLVNQYFVTMLKTFTCFTKGKMWITISRSGSTERTDSITFIITLTRIPKTHQVIYLIFMSKNLLISAFKKSSFIIIIIYWKYFKSFDWLKADGEIAISAW